MVEVGRKETVLRPGTLGPGASGVFRAVHAGNNDASAAHGNPAGAPETAPDRLRSRVRQDARGCCASALREAARRCGASAADLAAAMDESRSRVAEMMIGNRPIKAEHMYLLGLRRPEVLAAYAEELFG